MAARGARVTGIDLSPRLIEQARARDPAGDYRVADLSSPLDAGENFDAVGSYLVLAFNNPYSAIIDWQAVDYFDSV
jgi:2-polyprenyl-3-methyl-5-hydroxy-6-metoxy-1,4-benzoquinol methylase